MRELTRKVYRRASSFEVTIPKPLLFGHDPSNLHVVFSFEGRFYLDFSQRRREGRNIISRSVYRRGTSYETTIPREMMVGLDPDRQLTARFRFESKTKRWYLEVDHA